MNLHEKIWFILIDQKEEGPFSFFDMKSDWRVTADTLVWREGFVKWTPVRDVPELQLLLEREEIDEHSKHEGEENELVLDERREPPFRFLIFALIILTLSYVAFAIFWNR